MGQNISRVSHRRLHSEQDATELQSLVANAAPEPKSRRLKALTSKPARYSQTADFEGYIRAALLDVNGSAPEQIFRQSKCFPKPQLRKGVKNHILSFPGTFNPPLMGHKLLLSHTFFRSDLENLVASIISPNSTKSTKKKLKNETDALILSRKERVGLWSDPSLTPWSWINPYSHQKNGDSENHLLSAIETDGFEVEFVLVVGGDHISQAAAINDPGSLKPTVVFSDSLRSYPRAPTGSPLPLAGHGEWQKSEAPYAQLLTKLERVLHKPVTEEYASIPALQEWLCVSGSPWNCINLQEPALQIQFVPARNVAGAGIEDYASATGIRAVIQDVDSARRILALTHLALNPQMLSDLVKAKKKKKALKDAKQAARRRSQALS